MSQCHMCSVDSVATCPVCEQRVCNRHMVISAGSDTSVVGHAMVGGLNPVRLVHPYGESYLNQGSGEFLRGYTSGDARCHACRQRDGHAAARPTGALTAEELAAYDANAADMVAAFVAAAARRGVTKDTGVVIGERSVPIPITPTRWERFWGIQRGPESRIERETYNGYRIHKRERPKMTEAYPVTYRIEVWVFPTGVVGLRGDFVPETCNDASHREDPAIDYMPVTCSPEFTPTGYISAGRVRVDAAPVGALPVFCAPHPARTGKELNPHRGRPKTVQEIDATLSWLVFALDHCVHGAVDDYLPGRPT